MRSDQNSLRRYFPESTQTLLGVSNTEVIKLAGVAFAQHRGLTAEDWLARAERFAQDHTYHEYFIMASALVAKVARGLDDKDGRLLKRLQVWLERYVSNWAQCDDLCIKPLYVYLQRRPQLLERIHFRPCMTSCAPPCAMPSKRCRATCSAALPRLELEHLMTGKLTPGLAAASISSIINLT